MVRTQIQLSAEQAAALRRLSAATGKSAAELIRSVLDQYLAGAGGAGPTRQERVQRALRVAGMFSSGAADVSTEHDRYLADAFGQ